METIKINSVINKVSKANKPYKVFNTPIGDVSAFDTPLIAMLEANIGKELNVEIVRRNGFQNVTAIYPAEAVKPIVSKLAEAPLSVTTEQAFCTALKNLIAKAQNEAIGEYIDY